MERDRCRVRNDRNRLRLRGGCGWLRRRVVELSIAARLAPGIRWPYVSTVIAIEACPSCSFT